MIEVFKFRIATTPAKGGIRQRTNRIGLALDGTGVDHLPQFFNVLRSELSLADVLRAIRRDGVFLPLIVVDFFDAGQPPDNSALDRL